jgi:hypothetical protein
VCERKQNLRKQFQHEIRDGLARLRDQAEQERALSARAAEVDRVEHENLRREMLQLRAQIAVIHGLRALQGEVETARAEIPKLPAIVSQLQTETTNARTDTNKKIATLERELAATKKRLNRSRVDPISHESQPD